MKSAITEMEQRAIREACALWGWQDLDLDSAAEGIAAIGWFQVTKRTESKAFPSIGGDRYRDVDFWTLEETVMVSGYPSEPDYDDLQEFDDIEGDVWAMLEALRLREYRWKIQVELEDIGWNLQVEDEK